MNTLLAIVVIICVAILAVLMFFITALLERIITEIRKLRRRVERIVPDEEFELEEALDEDT